MESQSHFLLFSFLLSFSNLSSFSLSLSLLFSVMNTEQNLRGLRDSLVVADLSALDSLKLSEGLDTLWEDLSIATFVTLDDMVSG